MKCLINAQQRVRLRKNFANMEIKKRNDGVVVSPVNVIINHKCNICSLHIPTALI